MTKLPTRIQRSLDVGPWPRLLVEHGKHERVYRLIESVEELFTAARVIVEQRVDIGYYVDESRAGADLVDKSANGDGSAAWLLLCLRSDGEYEDVELVRFENR